MFSQAHQESKVLEDNVVTKEQEQELRTGSLPDFVKGKDDFFLVRFTLNFYWL